MSSVSTTTQVTSLRPLLNPDSVAVVGASPKGNRGLTVLRNLRRFGGSNRRVYAVHPRLSEVDGVPAFPSLADLPEVPEFVAVTVGADRVVPILEEAGRLGTRAGLVIASGFGEGGVGRERRRALRDVTRRYGMALCGPNCYGVLNAVDGFAAYSGDIVEPFECGHVALVMQSGALTHSITDSAVGRGLGLSHLITTGNELATPLDAYISALVDDARVHVIGVFVEGLRDPVAFAAAARRAHEAGKPVVALTVGRSERGRAAAMAHTGAVAGSDQAMAGFLRSAGVVRVHDIDELRETLIAFSHPKKPPADGAALVSISGGGAGLLADLATDVGVALPQPDGQVADGLRDLLPEFATVSNPLDVTGAAVENPELLPAAAARLADTTEVGVVALALNVPLASRGQEWLYRNQARQWAELARDSEVPMMAVTLVSGAVDPEIRASLRAAGVPLLVGARPALVALREWLRWHRTPLRPRPSPVELDLPSVFGDGRVVGGSTALNVLAAAGIPVPDAELVRTPEEASGAFDRLGGPVAVKVESPDLPHKTDVGGVALGITSAAEAAAVVRAMAKRLSSSAPDARVDGYLLQRQVRDPQVECLLGAVRDPQVGLMVSVAPGGVLVELGGPVPSLPAPLNREDAEELIDGTALSRLLAGYRGRPPADRDALVDLIVRFSHLVHQLDDRLGAAEINPVLVGRAGDGAVAVDALFIQESR